MALRVERAPVWQQADASAPIFARSPLARCPAPGKVMDASCWPLSARSQNTRSAPFSLAKDRDTSLRTQGGSRGKVQRETACPCRPKDRAARCCSAGADRAVKRMDTTRRSQSVDLATGALQRGLWKRAVCSGHHVCACASGDRVRLPGRLALWQSQIDSALLLVDFKRKRHDRMGLWRRQGGARDG